MIVRRHSSRSGLLALLVVLSVSPTANAVDGVIELNAVSMAAGIPTLGDTPGPPLTIGVPGSYILTSDLATTGANENAVEITADHVSLDLNGFSVKCSWIFTPCVGTGTGVGIVVTGENVAIRNGVVREMPDGGIDSPSALNLTVQHVRVIGNGGVGIESNARARVESCSVIDNFGDGILVGSRSIISDSASRNNVGIGIAGSFASRAIRNTVEGHAFGIIVQQGRIESNVVFGADIGVQGTNSLIRDNTVSGGTGNGITGTNALVIDNQIYQNGGFGISGTGAYGGNQLRANNSGAEVQASSPGTEIGTNLCGSDTVCP